MKTISNVLLLIPDDTPDNVGDTFAKDAVELPTEPVRVSWEFSQSLSDTVGHATLRKGDDGRIYADIEALDGVDVNALFTAYPCAGGTTLERFGSQIVKCQLRSVGLSTANSDSRIAPLREYR